MDLHPDLQRWRLAQEVLSSEEVADRVARWDGKPSSRVHGLVEQSNAIQRGRVPTVEVTPTFYIGEQRILVETSKPIEKPFSDLLSGGNGILDMYKWNQGNGNLDFDQKIAVDSGIASKYRQQLMHAPPIQPYEGELIEPPEQMEKIFVPSQNVPAVERNGKYVVRPGYNLAQDLPQNFVGGPPPAFGGDVQGMNALARAGEIGANAQAQLEIAPIAAVVPGNAADVAQQQVEAHGQAEDQKEAEEGDGEEEEDLDGMARLLRTNIFAHELVTLTLLALFGSVWLRLPRGLQLAPQMSHMALFRALRVLPRALQIASRLFGRALRLLLEILTPALKILPRELLVV